MTHFIHPRTVDGAHPNTYLLRTPDGGLHTIEALLIDEAIDACQTEFSLGAPDGGRADWLQDLPVGPYALTETYHETLVQGGDPYWDLCHCLEKRTGATLTRVSGRLTHEHRDRAPSRLERMMLLAHELSVREIRQFAASIGMPELIPAMVRYVPVGTWHGDHFTRDEHVNVEVHVGMHLPAEITTFETLVAASQEGDFAYEVVRVPLHGRWAWEATRYLDRDAFLHDDAVRADLRQWYGVFADENDLEIVQGETLEGTVNAIFDALIAGDITAESVAEMNERRRDPGKLEIASYIGEEGTYVEAVLPNAVGFIQDALNVASAMEAALVPNQVRFA